MMSVKRVCVYCGSSPGMGSFVETARALGREFAELDIGLIYGGGRVGMMGAIASAVFHAGGEVIGVIPRDLVSADLSSFKISDLLVVPSMHDRKALMIELADGFIALPGGFGTLEEFFEAVTWAQLGLHHKPCGILNIEGYYDKLLAFLEHSVDAQFIHSSHRSMIFIEEELSSLVSKFNRYRPPRVDKAGWVRGLNQDGSKD